MGLILKKDAIKRFDILHDMFETAMYFWNTIPDNSDDEEWQAWSNLTDAILDLEAIILENEETR